MEGRSSGAQGWRCNRRRVTSRAQIGAYFASAGEDMRGRIGAPIIDGHVGCIVIRPDRTRFAVELVAFGSRSAMERRKECVAVAKPKAVDAETPAIRAWSRLALVSRFG